MAGGSATMIAQQPLMSSTSNGDYKRSAGEFATLCKRSIPISLCKIGLPRQDQPDGVRNGDLGAGGAAVLADMPMRRVKAIL